MDKLVSLMQLCPANNWPALCDATGLLRLGGQILAGEQPLRALDADAESVDGVEDGVTADAVVRET